MYVINSINRNVSKSILTSASCGVFSHKSYRIDLGHFAYITYKIYIKNYISMFKYAILHTNDLLNVANRELFLKQPINLFSESYM